jgi:hypothetical protein
MVLRVYDNFSISDSFVSHMDALKKITMAVQMGYRTVALISYISFLSILNM